MISAGGPAPPARPMNHDGNYIGRFAPSPTGPLHLGSLCTALGSYLDARANNGRWLLRIENIDPPREQPGAAEAIIRSLQAHQLNWDGDILWQSERSEAYGEALTQLLAQHSAFYCSCSRAQLRESGGVHRGACVAPLNPDDAAIRLQVPDADMTFHDRLLGSITQNPGNEGDVVLRRRDRLFAYQLAVVVDDSWQGITDIVRGHDLISSSGWQLLLQQALGYPRPRYLHLPLLVDEHGDKLSKRSYAPPLDDLQPEYNIRRVLNYLRQPPPPPGLALSDLLSWSVSHYLPERIPRQPIPLT